MDEQANAFSEEVERTVIDALRGIVELYAPPNDKKDTTE
jgi:hypothetical protein